MMKGDRECIKGDRELLFTHSQKGMPVFNYSVSPSVTKSLGIPQGFVTQSIVCRAGTWSSIVSFWKRTISGSKSDSLSQNVFSQDPWVTLCILKFEKNYHMEFFTSTTNGQSTKQLGLSCRTIISQLGVILLYHLPTFRKLAISGDVFDGLNWGGCHIY